MSCMGIIASFASGFLNGYAQEYSSPAAHAAPRYRSPRTAFQGLIRHLASEFNAEVHWDEDGDAAAALIVRIQGDNRLLCISLHDDLMYFSAPSNLRFTPGCLPRFAGIAAQDILGQLCLADSKGGEAFRLVRECCMAAILGTIVRLRCDPLAHKQAIAAGTEGG